MAAVTSAVVVAAGTAYAANREGAAQKKAGRARSNAAQNTIDMQQGIYDQSRQDAMPWLQAGQNALAQLEQVNKGDYSAFQDSPDYQFALQQGLQGLDRSAAARGSLYSGGQQADVLNYASGLASQNLGNYRNNLMQLSSAGQGQSQYLGQLGNQFGNQYANAMGIKGDAQAQIAAAGPMTQAGYGNALAAGAGAYAGAAGGGGAGGGWGNFLGMGGGGNSGGQGSYMGFGNNVNGLINMGRTSSWGN